MHHYNILSLCALLLACGGAANPVRTLSPSTTLTSRSDPLSDFDPSGGVAGAAAAAGIIAGAAAAGHPFPPLVLHLPWTNQPKTEPQCHNTGGKSPDAANYSNDEIEAALQAAVDAIVNNKLAKSKDGAQYPHRNTPGNNKSSKDSWADYNLDGCAQENSDDATKAAFVEFPILRKKNAYTGGKAGPDRVLFQFVTDGKSERKYDTPGFEKLVGNFGMSSRMIECICMPPVIMLENLLLTLGHRIRCLLRHCESRSSTQQAFRWWLRAMQEQQGLTSGGSFQRALARWRLRKHCWLWRIRAS